MPWILSVLQYLSEKFKRSILLDSEFAYFNTIYIWAVTRDFQQCGILTSVDSDQPVQPHFKLLNSK